MIKKIIYSSLLLMIGASLTSKAQNSEQRTLAPFTSIAIDTKSNVTIQQGEVQSVSVESQELDKVQTTVTNETLHIKGKSSKINITIPTLNSINIGGLGDVNVNSTFRNEILELNISGNGKIITPVETDKLKVRISGNGKLKLNGTANDLELDVSGNGKVDAEELHVKNVTANISGIGKCLVDVTDNLDVHVSGNGTVYYKTEPAHITKHVSGIAHLGNINTTEEDDSTTVHVGNKRIVIIAGDEKEVDIDDDIKTSFDDNFNFTNRNKKPRSHWMGFDIGYNGLLNSDFNTSLPKGYEFLELNTGKSVAVNFNFFAHDFPIYRRYVMFTSGLGMSINNFRFTSDRVLIPEIDSVDAYPDTLSYSLSKYKLEIAYVTVPALIQFNTSEQYKKSFHIATGVLFSYRFESHTKQVYDQEGEKIKAKNHDDFNLAPFRCDGTVRIGYRGYTIFANYAFTDLFYSGRGPELHPFTIGLSLINW